MGVVVKAEGLGKRYRVGRGGGSYTALRDVLAQRARGLAAAALGRTRPGADERSDPDFWALREASFEIRRGEVVGIIGRNGAGKSTLLKVLSRITAPSEGRVTVRGRIASLLEVGTGFHPELTGRENVFLNGAILGMSRAEIRRKFDEIVAFAETEAFLDTPVKHYSSGMYVRLAFAVAAHLEAEILVVDEVLAVGDAEFQARCLGKMGDLASSGRTVLFVSHNLSALERLCGSALLLEKGRIVAQGAVAPVTRRYLDGAVQAVLRADRSKVRSTGELIRVTEVGFRVGGVPARSVQSGEACEFTIAYECLAPGRLKRPPSFTVEIHLNGQKVVNLWSDYDGSLAPLPERGTVRCAVPRWPFREGAVRIDLFVQVGSAVQDWIEDVLTLNSFDGPFYGARPLTGPGQGIMFLDHAWTTTPDGDPGRSGGTGLSGNGPEGRPG